VFSSNRTESCPLEYYQAAGYPDMGLGEICQVGKKTISSVSGMISHPHPHTGELIFKETGRILDARRQQSNPESVDSLVLFRDVAKRKNSGVQNFIFHLTIFFFNKKRRFLLKRIELSKSGTQEVYIPPASVERHIPDFFA
jgi:hypothetical protein